MEDFERQDLDIELYRFEQQEGKATVIVEAMQKIIEDAEITQKRLTSELNIELAKLSTNLKKLTEALI
jgi:hypothetical protein